MLRWLILCSVTLSLTLYSGGRGDRAEPKMPKCGGLGAVKAADQDVQDICDQFRVEVEQRSGINFTTLQAVEYKTQVVAGTNYFIKAHIGGDQYVHLRIYKKLPCYQSEMSLTAFQLDKTRQDDIVHFEPNH